MSQDAGVCDASKHIVRHMKQNRRAQYTICKEKKDGFWQPGLLHTVLFANIIFQAGPGGKCESSEMHYFCRSHPAIHWRIINISKVEEEAHRFLTRR